MLMLLDAVQLRLPWLLANPRGQLTLTLGKCCAAPDQVWWSSLGLAASLSVSLSKVHNKIRLLSFCLLLG